MGQPMNPTVNIGSISQYDTHLQTPSLGSQFSLFTGEDFHLRFLWNLHYTFRTLLIVGYEGLSAWSSHIQPRSNPTELWLLRVDKPSFPTTKGAINCLVFLKLGSRNSAKCKFYHMIWTTCVKRQTQYKISSYIVLW